MATNGESARQWLVDHEETAPLERIIKIRDSLLKKIDVISESDNIDLDEEFQGLTEALDVMEDHIIKNSTQTSDQPEPDLDHSTLIQDSAVGSPPILNNKEKRAIFNKLLKTRSNT